MIDTPADRCRGMAKQCRAISASRSSSGRPGNTPPGAGPVPSYGGKAGAPKEFEDYAKRYPPLAHGAKRHLTMPWTPGLTPDEVAEKAKCDRSRIKRAIATGMLDATKHGRTIYVTKTDATRWITRKCTVGAREASLDFTSDRGEALPL